MEIQIRTVAFKQFLKRCHMPKVITDLVIQASDNKITARFGDVNHVIYGEIFEEDVKIVKEGLIRIVSLKQVIDVINRVETDIIKIVSNDKVFVITDGNTAGKFRTEMFQASEAEIIASFAVCEGKQPFDRKAMTYSKMKFQYDSNIEVKIGTLNTIIADSKAFGLERYHFNLHQTKKAGTFLRCSIENGNSGDKFHRTITNSGNGCKIEDINEATFGQAFKDVVSALSGDKTIKKDDKDVQKVLIYIHKEAMLLTDGKSYFYNLSAVDED